MTKITRKDLNRIGVEPSSTLGSGLSSSGFHSVTLKSKEHPLQDEADALSKALKQPDKNDTSIWRVIKDCHNGVGEIEHTDFERYFQFIRRELADTEQLRAVIIRKPFDNGMPDDGLLVFDFSDVVADFSGKKITCAKSELFKDRKSQSANYFPIKERAGNNILAIYGGDEPTHWGYFRVYSSRDALDKALDVGSSKQNIDAIPELELPRYAADAAKHEVVITLKKAFSGQLSGIFEATGAKCLRVTIKDNPRERPTALIFPAGLIEPEQLMSAETLTGFWYKPRRHMVLDPLQKGPLGITGKSGGLLFVLTKPDYQEPDI